MFQSFPFQILQEGNQTDQEMAVSFCYSDMKCYQRRTERYQWQAKCEENYNLCLLINKQIPCCSLCSIRGLKISASTRTTFQFQFASFTLSCHIPIPSHKIASLPKTNMKSQSSGNITGLKSKLALYSTSYSWSNLKVSISRNLLLFYHECRSLFGYATRSLNVFAAVATHYLSAVSRHNRHRKPREENLWHPGYCTFEVSVFHKEVSRSPPVRKECATSHIRYQIDNIQIDRQITIYFIHGRFHSVIYKQKYVKMKVN